MRIKYAWFWQVARLGNQMKVGKTMHKSRPALKESQASISSTKRSLKLQYIQVCLGGTGEGEIPDPIPNSEVKTLIADGTLRKSRGE